jgi:hypothetical protein
MPRVPYEIPPRGGLAVVGGQPNVFALDFPGQAVITKIAIVPTGGAPGAFTAALYNANPAALGQDESESTPGTPGAQVLPPDLYRITPDLASTGGKLVYFSEDSTGGYGFLVYNQDLPRNNNLGKLRKVYLEITPAGSGEFAVALGGEAYQ